MTDDTLLPFELPTVRRKKLVAAFDGGRLPSDGGVMLLALAERRLGVMDLRPGRSARAPAALPGAGQAASGTPSEDRLQRTGDPNRTPIHWRPVEASCRTEFGHREADLMHFHRKRDALVTLQERKTQITLGSRLSSKQAETTVDQIVAKLAARPKRARRSATFDNGGEWVGHELLRAPLGMKTYFCDPHTPLGAWWHRERQRRAML